MALYRCVNCGTPSGEGFREDGPEGVCCFDCVLAITAEHHEAALRVTCVEAVADTMSSLTSEARDHLVGFFEKAPIEDVMSVLRPGRGDDG